MSDEEQIVFSNLPAELQILVTETIGDEAHLVEVGPASNAAFITLMSEVVEGSPDPQDFEGFSVSAVHGNRFTRMDFERRGAKEPWVTKTDSILLSDIRRVESTGGGGTSVDVSVLGGDDYTTFVSAEIGRAIIAHS